MKKPESWTFTFFCFLTSSWFFSHMIYMNNSWHCDGSRIVNVLAQCRHISFTCDFYTLPKRGEVTHLPLCHFHNWPKHLPSTLSLCHQSSCHYPPKHCCLLFWTWQFTWNHNVHCYCVLQFAYLHLDTLGGHGIEEVQGPIELLLPFLAAISWLEMAPASSVRTRTVQPGIQWLSQRTWSDPYKCGTIALFPTGWWAPLLG